MGPSKKWRDATPANDGKCSKDLANDAGPGRRPSTRSDVMSGSRPIERVLDALPDARRRQAGQWSARCPAHDDRGPSLSVRENEHGAVLLHCFAGCEVTAVVASMGLELHDLFPPRDRPAGSPARTPTALTAAQALDLLHTEASFIAVCAASLARGVPLTASDRALLNRDAGRIAYIRAAVMK